MADPPRPYTMAEPSFSSGRTLLSNAFEHYCVLEWGLSGEDIEDAFASDDEGDRTRDSVRTLARQLVALFASGDVATFARPFGGAPVSVRPALWELDDFDRRFATSAIALDRPFDPAAAPTHWLFVETRAFQELVDRVFAEYRPPARAHGTTSAQRDEVVAAAPGPVALRPAAMLRLPEVMRRTGLSKSTIYDRARRGSFPEGQSLGGGLTGWLEADVEEWIGSLPR